MKHILHYSEKSDSELISKYFQDKEQVIASVFTVENFTWEANLLNSVESVLSENLAFDLHFDMIIDGGQEAIQEYYRQISVGSNSILEKAKRYTSDLTTINESLDLLKQQLKQRALHFLNEQTASLGGLDIINQVNQLLTKPVSAPATGISAPATGISAPAAPSELDSAFDNVLGTQKPASAEGDWSSWSGVYTKIKNLLSAITEGGSPIGILHLLLDLASFVPAIGPLFDIINSCIYFYRGNQPNAPKGMWLLGTISLISGVTFGAGQVFKGLKFGAKSTAEVIEQMAKGGSRAGIEALSKVPAKEKGVVVKLLSFIARNVGVALGKATSLLGKSTEKIIGKLSSYIPFIGKPLEKVFGMIGTTLTKYGEKMAKFSKDFAEVEKGVLKGGAKEGAEIAAKNSVKKMLGKGGIMEVDAKGVVTVLDSSGKEIGRFSKEVLTSPELWGRKAPGLFGKGEEKVAAGYFNGATKASEMSVLAGATRLLKGAAKATGNVAKLMILLGKQAIKVMFGEEALADNKYTEKELEYWGNSAFNSYMDNLRKKQEKETGAVYKPDVILDSSEKEAFEHITKYQQNYAKLTGQPDIITVVYDKYGSQDTENQFKDFWGSVAEGKVKRDGAKDKIEHNSDKESSNESFIRMKHITSFSKFHLR